MNSGSNWIRCDLHVHTPMSVVQGYGGDKESVWEKYIIDLENLPSEFKILGINDYLFLDGYEKVLAYKKNGRLPNLDLILPVLEFRLDIFAGHKSLSRINYHVIFADEEVLPLKSIKKNFLNRLAVKKTFGNDNSWDECIENKDALERFGQFCLANIPESKVGNEGPLFIGFKNLTHRLSDIADLLKSSNFRINGKKAFFTSIGRSEWENMRWESGAADKRQIINSTDFVFTGCETQEMYERGRASLIENEVNSKLLHFSDAHHFSDNTVDKTMKIGQSMTWIKCKPTFEGLSQLKFVFDERVRISEKSITAKKPYNVISKVQFNDNTGEGLFQEKPIYLNEDLNAIIGGKSTGKSLLLHHIAKSIDAREVLSKNSVVEMYNHESNQDFDFTVVWKDGKKDTLKDTNKTGRKIVYISQSYIDELTSDQFDNRIKFNEFVLSILLQDTGAKERFDSFEEAKNINLRVISSSLHKLFAFREEKLKKEEELTEIGDLEGVNSYIKQLNSDINVLKSNGLSTDESKAYEDYMKQQRNVKIKIDDLTKDLERITDFYSLAESNLDEISNEYESTIDLISTSKIKESIRGRAAIYATWKKNLNDSRVAVIAEIKDLLKRSDEELEKLSRLINPLSEKTSKVAELKKKMLELSEEQNRLIKINTKIASIKDLSNKVRSQVELILTNYEELENAYHELANDLKEFSGVSQELDISIQVRFNTNQFNNEIENNRANKPSLKRVYPSMINNNDAFEYVFDKSNHKQSIRTFLESILSGNIKLNQHGNPRQLAKAIFENYFYLNFSVKYQNDILEDMSPGKKNLVVLKLLIELNNSEYPILIDQPEDDLDNRSIYEDLVKFLKFKKHQRQIILVTHNPNVVVGTDCENTIVANQEGQILGRENRKYKFEYVNGAIEDSFNKPAESGVLYQKGVKEHICDILEGGEKAFQERESRYNFIKS